MKGDKSLVLSPIKKQIYKPRSTIKTKGRKERLKRDKNWSKVKKIIIIICYTQFNSKQLTVVSSTDSPDSVSYKLTILTSAKKCRQHLIWKRWQQFRSSLLSNISFSRTKSTNILSTPLFKYTIRYFGRQLQNKPSKRVSNVDQDDHMFTHNSSTWLCWIATGIALNSAVFTVNLAWDCTRICTLQWPVFFKKSNSLQNQEKWRSPWQIKAKQLLICSEVLLENVKYGNSLRLW